LDKFGGDESAEAKEERLKRNVALLRRALATHVKRVMKLFEEWDEDGDGTVSKAEFRLAMRSLTAQWGLRVSREDIECLFDSLDDSGDGLISYSELKEMVREERALLKAEREGGADGKQKKRVHTGADKQKPSVIKSLVVPVGGKLLDALREALERSGRRAIDLFRDWDADGTGMLSRDEFRVALSKLGIQPPAVALADIDALFTHGQGRQRSHRGLRHVARPPEVDRAAAHLGALGRREGEWRRAGRAAAAIPTASSRADPSAALQVETAPAALRARYRYGTGDAHL